MTADLHFGHKTIDKYREWTGGNNVECISDLWNSVVKKRDVVYVLGDAAFTEEGVTAIRKLNGFKNLVLGNHDGLPITSYARAFKYIMGGVSYKRAWLTHIPIMKEEMRGRINIHGHVHANMYDDREYINVNVDALWEQGLPILFNFTEYKLKHYDRAFMKWNL